MKVYYRITMLIALSFALILAQAGGTKDEGGRCGPHEKWENNGTPPECIKTCANRNVQFKCIPSNSSACYCEKDYIREFKNGPCIRICDCPPLDG